MDHLQDVCILLENNAPFNLLGFILVTKIAVEKPIKYTVFKPVKIGKLASINSNIQTKFLYRYINCFTSKNVGITSL